MAVVPIQTVTTKAEHEALALANLLRTGHVNAAAERLVKFTETNKLALWEQAAIADMAKAMNAGRKWKRA